jgi:hypothetical protein
MFLCGLGCHAVDWDRYLSRRPQDHGFRR